MIIQRKSFSKSLKDITDEDIKRMSDKDRDKLIRRARLNTEENIAKEARKGVIKYGIPSSAIGAIGGAMLGSSSGIAKEGALVGGFISGLGGSLIGAKKGQYKGKQDPKNKELGDSIEKRVRDITFKEYIDSRKSKRKL